MIFRSYESSCPVCNQRSHWVIPPADSLSRCPNEECGYVAPAGQEEDAVFADTQRPCPVCEHPGPHHVDPTGRTWLEKTIVYCAGCQLRFEDIPPKTVVPTGIEYTDAFQRVVGVEGLRGELWSDFSVEGYYVRQIWVRKYAWAIPTPEALGAVAAFSPIVEMGAGTGYWAHELQKRGAKVVPFDVYPPDGSEWPRNQNGDLARYTDDGQERPNVNWYHRGADSWTVVHQGTPDVLRDYGPPWTLLLSWPPYDKGMGMEAVGHFRGDRIVYVGEYEGGCCGDKHMWRLLARFWTPVREIAIPQWQGIHDYVTVYERKSKVRRQIAAVAGT